jgi:hypothetical protein
MEENRNSFSKLEVEITKIMSCSPEFAIQVAVITNGIIPQFFVTDAEQGSCSECLFVFFGHL